MSILSVFDVIEVIWTPQNTYLHQNGIEFEGYSYWCGWSCSVTFFYKSTVDKLMSTLESDYSDVHRGLKSGFASNRSGYRVMHTF